MREKPVLQVNSFYKNFELHEQKRIIPSSFDVNLTVFSGRLTAITGRTGSGKSTVLKGIYRTYLPTSGQIIYRTEAGHQMDLAIADEHSILALRQKEIGFVTQFLHALPRQSTEDVVSQPLLRNGFNKSRAQTMAREMLAAMKLPERLWGISPCTFSGGEKQRVNLARGMVTRPRLLLLDEPTSSLDPDTTEIVIRLIEELKGESVGMLAIFHDPDLVERIADDVVDFEAPLAIENILSELTV